MPRGQKVAFALAETLLADSMARAAVVKDAGDDPDVTHGALVRVTVRLGMPGTGVVFRAGEGVGMVTLPGLPIPPGEPAINPTPRQMIRDAIAAVAMAHGRAADAIVEIAIPGGAEIAQRTMNPRLGIVGGLSILGTTGIVVPYSCSAWIHSIHRGIDVARAAGIDHVAGATGRTSEQAIQALHGLPELALIDMGDFVGGMLKYLRAHPVARVTVAGGVGKMTKLAQGRLDLHSKRHPVDFQALAEVAESLGADAALTARIARANTTAEAFALAGALKLGDQIAAGGWDTASAVLDRPEIALEVVVFNSTGVVMGRAVQGAASLNRR